MIRLLLVWQLVVAIVAGLAGLVVSGRIVGMSALLGGAICWLPNCWFAWRAFRFNGARAARQIVKGFYAGQAGKMLLTSAMFALVFIRIRPLSALALFVGFAATQAVSWVVPIVHARAEAGRERS